MRVLISSNKHHTAKSNEHLPLQDSQMGMHIDHQDVIDEHRIIEKDQGRETSQREEDANLHNKLPLTKIWYY